MSFILDINNYYTPLYNILNSIEFEYISEYDIFNIKRLYYNEYYSNKSSRFTLEENILSIIYGFSNEYELKQKLILNTIYIMKSYCEYYRDFRFNDLIEWYQYKDCIDIENLYLPCNFKDIYEHMTIEQICNIRWDGFNNPFL